VDGDTVTSVLLARALGVEPGHGVVEEAELRASGYGGSKGRHSGSTLSTPAYLSEGNH